MKPVTPASMSEAYRMAESLLGYYVCMERYKDEAGNPVGHTTPNREMAFAESPEEEAQMAAEGWMPV